jgi:endoglucanase
MARDRALDIMARLGAQPAVAFYEGGVASEIEAILSEIPLPFKIDEFGNIIARIPGRNSEVPPLALVAHMDHPGFEAVEVQDEYLIGDALGGVPPSSFDPGVRLQVVLADGQRLPAETAGHHGDESDRKVLIKLDQPQEVDLPCTVVFDLPDFQLDGNLIRMRAVDDLAGCGSILAVLARLAENGPDGDVYGVFTRAEEVGLVGARLMAEAGTLPSETLVLSAESSRALPGAEMGSGPVVRVGDAGYTFDAEAESALIRARETLQARPEGFSVQRQLMSGGTCEASAFALHGYRTTGIAFPLGNYHNGAPDGSIEAEYIHVDDFMGGIELMLEASYRVSDRANTVFRERLRQVPDGFRQRLRDTVQR